MPFGLKNAAQTIQRLMDYSKAYIVCLFILVTYWLLALHHAHEHIQDLKTVCNRLQQYGLTIRLEKCLFGVSEIDFLGHLIVKMVQCHFLQRLSLLVSSQNLSM